MSLAGQTVRIFEELADPNARAGRKVRLGTTVYTVERPARAHADNAQRVLGRFLRSAYPGPDALEIREAPGGFVLETSADGELAESWSVPALIQSLDEGTRQVVQDMGLRVRGLEVAAVDRDADAREVHVAGDDEWAGDTTGEINPDGSVNWSAVAGGSIQEGVGNVTRAIGAGIRNAAEGAIGGITQGLGVLWTIVLVLVLLVLGIFLVKGGL